MHIKKYAFASCILISSLIGKQASAQVPMNGLAALYNFCGNANDASGNNKNLSVMGPALSSDRFGNASKAYSFNGALGDYLIYNDTLTSMGSWTYSVWVYPTITQNSIIIANGNSGSDGYGLVMNDGAQSVPGKRITLFIGGIKYVPSQPVTLNAWHHGAIRRLNGVISLFVDGVKVDSTTTIPYAPSVPYKFSVGRENATGLNPFTGSIDEIAVYNRGLSDAEITQLFNANCAVAPSLQPTSKSVTRGTGTQFTIGGAISGFTYQWQAYTGAAWYNLTNSTTYSGVTSTTLTIANAQSSISGTQYRCLIKNTLCCSTGNSNPATLTVTPPASVSGAIATDPAIRVTQTDKSHILLSWENAAVNQWTVFDLAGRKLATNAVASNTSSAIIAVDLAPGIYVIGVSTSTGQLITQKLLVD
jgi:hypothetical protein